MKLQSFAIMAAATMIWNSAAAESWRAEMVIVAGQKPSCPNAALVYEFSLDGGNFSGRTPGGKPFQAPIAPDGAVTAGHDSTYGPISIVGNAKTKALELTASRLACRYALRPMVSSIELDAEWNAQVVVEKGVPRNCGDGPWIWKIKMVGQSFIATGARDTVILNLRSLLPDGSGRVIGKSQKGIDYFWDFEAGTGPRKIHQSDSNTECGYRWTPTR
jgi:hypothetical protein